MEISNFLIEFNSNRIQYNYIEKQFFYEMWLWGKCNFVKGLVINLQAFSLASIALYGVNLKFFFDDDVKRNVQIIVPIIPFPLS